MSTTAVLVAAAVLLGLGAAAHWASDDQAGAIVIGASSAVPDLAAPSQPAAGGQSSPSPVSTTPSTDAEPPKRRGTEPVGPKGVVSRQLVAAPDSDCRHFVESSGRFPTITISIQNSCQ